MLRRTALTGLGVGVLLVAATRGARAEPAPASPHEVSHPLLLWTKQEAAEIRKLIEAEPWAKREFERSFPKGLKPEERRTIDNLFLYSVMGDKSCLELEKDKLRQFIGCPPYVKDSFDWQWHYVDHYQMVLRYDTLYDELTAGEQRGLLRTFWNLALFGIREERIRSVDGGHPRMASHILCSLMTRDKRIIQGIFETSGGFKSLIDSLMDGRLSPGAGNPYLRTLGHLLLWCRGCERLGLDQFGYGYTSPSGASMKSFMRGMIDVADPRIEIPGGMPYYGRVALQGMPSSHIAFSDRLPMGQYPPGLFFAPIVPGGKGIWQRWSADATGTDINVVFDSGEAKMLLPLCLELAHGKWPDAGFDYFLAQMRAPTDETYQPSLYWHVRPIDPKTAKPPAVRSVVFPQRGLAVLRAEESSGYWDSPAPMAALQIGAPIDRNSPGGIFSLKGFLAFNRLIYRSHLGRYRDPWFAGARSNCTVSVDNLQFGKAIRDGVYVQEQKWPRAVGEVPTRFAADELVKFVGVRAKPRTIQVKQADGTTVARTLEIYPGVDMERCLMLTRQYLLDVFRVQSDKPRTYHWILHAVGVPLPDRLEDWKLTDELNEKLASPGTREHPIATFEDQRAYDAADRTWAMTALQSYAFADITKSRLGPQWYDRQIGARVTMLGQDATTAYFARSPKVLTLDAVALEARERQLAEKTKYILPARSTDYDKGDKQATGIKPPPEDLPPEKRPPPKIVIDKAALQQRLGPESEVGDVSIIAERRCPATAFVVLHEPFLGGKWTIRDFRRIQQTPDAVAVAVVGGDGSPVNDRLMLGLGDDPKKVVTLADENESFTFADRACVRVGRETVRVSGDLRAMKVRVAGEPKLVVNGKQQEAKVAEGYLSFGP